MVVNKFVQLPDNMGRSMSREAVIEDVSAERVRAHVEKIVTEIPHRAAGSENGRRMAEYSRDALKADGIESVRIHELPAIVSFPKHADFKVLTPTAKTIEANTLGHSTETGEAGVEGELIYVGSGAFSDYEGIDVTGKIILTELSYSPARHEKQRIAALKGAVGAVMMNWGHPENEAVPFGSVKPVWGNPTPENYESQMPTIPCIGIARTTGLELKRACQSGGVNVWFRTHVENGWRPIQITIGEISPDETPEPDDFVLMGGHQDSWPGEAATDNAAGNACIMEIARVLNKHRSKLRRGVVCGFWTAHETGTMAGSAWWADREWARLRDHAVAYLQIDQPACIGTTTRWATASNAELKSFHETIEAELLEGREQLWHRAAKNGDSSFFGLGIPMFHGAGSFTDKELQDSANANLGWWHHSIDCRIDKLDWEWMKVHLRIYTAWMWELCTAPVLPFAFSPVADQVTSRLDELAEPGKAIGLESTLAAAARFAGAAAAFDGLTADWRGRFANGQGDEKVARILNRTMKRLSRILVPLQSTAIGKYGHDSYGFTPQTTMIPSLYDVPYLASLPDGEERWMLKTRLMRDRNRVNDGLNDACDLIADADALIGAGR